MITNKADQKVIEHIQETRETLDRVIDERDIQRAKVAELTMEIDRLKQATDRAIAERDALTARVGELTTELNQCQEKNDDLIHAYMQRERALRTAEEERDTLQARCRALEAVVEAAREFKQARMNVETCLELYGTADGSAADNKMDELFAADNKMDELFEALDALGKGAGGE